MDKQRSVKEQDVRKSTAPGLAMNDIEAPKEIVSISRETCSNSDWLVRIASCIKLNLEKLKCFEVVDGQFQHQGIRFSNCIAIHPSNPAFPAHSGSTVLMGAPKNGWLEVTFQQPARSVSAYVTSAQRMILSAYDSYNEPLAQVELPGPNLAGSDASIPPNQQLSLQIPNISRITFCAFDGQFTVDDISIQF